MKKRIAPSILSADFTRLGEELNAVEAAGADWIHIDVMDGHFVPNITYGPVIVEACKRATPLPLDVHLMILRPELIIPDFIKAGADSISVHVETCPHLNRTLQMIKEGGVRAGAALNPSTPLETLDWVLEYLDFVLIMSVNPGFGGQTFIPGALDKIKDLKQRLAKKNPEALIQVDGGVNDKTIGDLAAVGVDVFVAGSAIFGTQDYADTIRRFRAKTAEGTMSLK